MLLTDEGKGDRLKELIMLLSRIRLSAASFNQERVAQRQYLFPVAGAIFGLIFASFAYFLFHLLVNQLSPLIIGLLVIAFIYLLTGLLHLEGLCDFGDGLMASGDVTKKRDAMKDVSLGAAGIFFLIMNIFLLLLLIGELEGWADPSPFWYWYESIPLVIGIAISEISAKLAMQTVMFLGPSSHEGMGRVFVSEANLGRFLIGVGIALGLSLLISGIYFLIVLLGIAAGAIIAFQSRRHFGGVGGDAFGASNEFGRLLTLFCWVILI